MGKSSPKCFLVEASKEEVEKKMPVVLPQQELVTFVFTNFETKTPITQAFSEQVNLSCEQIELYCPGVEAFQTEKIAYIAEEIILKYPIVEAEEAVVIEFEN